MASFPLAPLFALFNNIVEIRLDAFKFVNLRRRVPVRNYEKLIVGSIFENKGEKG